MSVSEEAADMADVSKRFGDLKMLCTEYILFTFVKSLIAANTSEAIAEVRIEEIRRRHGRQPLIGVGVNAIVLRNRLDSPVDEKS